MTNLKTEKILVMISYLSLNIILLLKHIKTGICVNFYVSRKIRRNASFCLLTPQLLLEIIPLHYV